MERDTSIAGFRANRVLGLVAHGQIDGAITGRDAERRVSQVIQPDGHEAVRSSHNRSPVDFIEVHPSVRGLRVDHPGHILRTDEPVDVLRFKVRSRVPELPMSLTRMGPFEVLMRSTTV